MEAKPNNYGTIICLGLLAIVIAISPWESIRSYEFIDLARNKDRYISYSYLYDIFYGEPTSFLYYLSNEYFWHKILFVFSKSGVEATAFFTALSIFCLTTTFIYIYLSTKNALYCFLCIHPIYLDFVLSQQRNSLALALILIAISATNRKIKLISIWMSVFTHLTSALIIGTLFLSQKISDILKSKILAWMTGMILSLIIASLIAFGREIILNPLNDRRAIDYAAESFSVIYATPWLMYSGIIILLNKKNRVGLVDLFSSISFAIFFFLSLFEFYGIRFAMTGLPFFVSALQNLKSKSIFIAIYTIHTIWLFYIWLKI